MITIEKDAKQASVDLQGFISRLEVDTVGIASLDDWKGTKLEETALKLLPSARSVVVLAMEVFPEILEHLSIGKRIDHAPMRDLLQSHAEYLNSRLTKAAYDVAKALHRTRLKAFPLAARGLPLDFRRFTSVFSYKHAAQAAGMGNIGRHSLLITPDFGPRVRLSGCLTEAVLKPTTPGKLWECGQCHICIDNCPAGALENPQGDEPYRINKFACNAFRAGDYCSECLRLCPASR